MKREKKAEWPSNSSMQEKDNLGPLQSPFGTDDKNTGDPNSVMWIMTFKGIVVSTFQIEPNLSTFAFVLIKKGRKTVAASGRRNILVDRHKSISHFLVWLVSVLGRLCLPVSVCHSLNLTGAWASWRAISGVAVRSLPPGTALEMKWDKLLIEKLQHHFAQ